MVVVGFVGEKGSGKGTAVRLIAEALPPETRCQGVRFSDLLRETLTLWHLPHTRANLQDLSKMMDAQFGNGTLAHAMGHRIATVQADVVILDGVRWEADRLLIRSFPANLLIAVTANPRVRYERLRARGEKAQESSTTFAQFLEEEGAIAERAIPAIAATADVTIENNHDLASFEREVRRCSNEHVRPLLAMSLSTP